MRFRTVLFLSSLYLLCFTVAAWSSTFAYQPTSSGSAAVDTKSISGKIALAHMAAQSTIKLAAVQPYIDQAMAARTLANHYAEPVELARMQLAQAVVNETRTGF